MDALLCIGIKHRSIIATNTRYKLLIESVKAGSLQNVCIFQNNFITYKYNIKNNSVISNIIRDTTHLCYLLRKFNKQYFYSIHSYFTYPSNSIYLNQVNQCYAYRTIHNISYDLDTLYHPIPFSTANQIEYARKWMFADDTDIILKIQFNITDPYIAICDDEHEIIFPPSVIHVTSKTKCDYQSLKYQLWECTISFNHD